MKKTLILLVVFLLIGCKNTSDGTNSDSKSLPPKISASDSGAQTSPINSSNLDNYMFREDVQYVDLRSAKMILEEGYVAGFEFIPYYSIIASFSEYDALFQMKTVIGEDGTRYPAGQVGGFVPQYLESEQLVKNLFSRDKYIFLISQGGSEGSYLIKLLLQLGYDGEKIYNVGGVSHNEGIASYKSIKSNKYYVEGNGTWKAKIDYDYLSDLTPIN